MTPFFTIVSPVYNRASIVGETINTVLNQEFTDFEYVLVDDKSTDNSLEVLQEFAKKDARIQIVEHQENLGRCIARNTGIENANGKWICYLDSDDFYHSNHLKVLFQLIQSHPEIEVFATEQTWNQKPKAYNNKKHLNDNIILTIDDFITSNPISSNQICFKNSLQTRWIKERLPISEDWLYHRQLVLEAPIYKTRTVTTDVRIHDERSLDTTDILTFVKWNLYAAKKFIELEAAKLSNARQNQITSYIHLLCANILLSKNNKKEALPLLFHGLQFFSSWKNPLLYKAFLKILLPKF
jgi:glycosyltransferase involved in cell wall biosynthesis